MSKPMRASDGRGVNMKAIVTWFDRRDGEGVMRDDSDTPYRIAACNIPGKKTWFPHTACVYYERGQTVEFELVEGCADLVRCLTPGHFDRAKWDALDHKRLAFRCDASGQATTGLFASKAAKHEEGES